jgi:hypothetical protein
VVLVDRSLLRLVEDGGGFAVARKIEGFGEFLVLGVRQLVGEGVLLVDAFGQHLAHEGLGIVHVFETMRLHGIVEDPGIGHEFIDRFDLGNPLEIIFAFPGDLGLAGDPLDRARQVPRDQVVACVC